MTPDPDPLQDQNARSFDELRFALNATQGQFKLLFGHCNYSELRQRISGKLLIMAPESGDSDRQIIELQVTPETTSLLPSLLECAMTQPYAVIISGFETAPNVRGVLEDLNQRRELLRDRCAFPILFWLDDQLLSLMVRHLPDLESWATIYAFDIAPEQLIEQIDRFCNQVFERVMTPNFEPFLRRYPLIRDRDRLELDLGLRRLQRSGYQLTPQLRANVHFIVGRRAYEQDKIDVAIHYFQDSLNYWVTVGETLTIASTETLSTDPDGTTDLTAGLITDSTDSTDSNDSTAPITTFDKSQAHQQIQALSKQGVLWVHLGLCQLPGHYLPDQERQDRLQQAAQSFRHGLAAFTAAMRPEFNAAAIVCLAEVLDDLKAWRSLQGVLRQAITLHKQYGAPMSLAADYLLLAEVAMQEQRWQPVQLWAARAVQLLSSILPDTSRPSQDRAMLMQIAYLYQARVAQQRNSPSVLAQNLDRAIEQLSVALADNAPMINPARYLHRLERSRQMYFALGHYREALQLKLKSQFIAQQYGFQAFVGIGQLEARCDSSPIQRDSGAPVSPTEAVSREIQASGRGRDIQNLVALLVRPDRKLIAIHGQSGVGKSSLVQAGLVPTLQRTLISGRVVLPVVLGLYADWPARLAQQLNHNLSALGYTPIAGLQDLEDKPWKFDVDRILEAVTDLTTQDLALVFIFDQFEEFFFANADPADRLNFYYFLDRLLSLPFVKAALTVRDDCLHCLLECDRWLSMEVTQGDILNQASRYYIGNFSRGEARNLIRSLSGNGSTFTLDADLIEELVRDLSAEISEVRPIELQIVGVQLQHERITSLEQYRAAGPKAKFVRRFLIEMIGHCGPEHKATAIALMFCLTDKNGTRPIRTRADLAQVSNASPDQLDTILHILCECGLIFALPDLPAYRYQLVHDYFVPFIRQEQELYHSAETEALRQENRQLNEDKELLEQLAEAHDRRQRSERTSRRLLALGAIVSTLGSIAFALLATSAQHARQRAETAERQAAFAAIDARSSAATARWLAHDSLNAIVDGLRATLRLAVFPGAVNDPDLNALTYTTLQTLNPILQNVTERNRLEGHSNSILGVEFAPNGTFLASISWDESLRVWSASGHERYQIPKAHREAVTAVAIAPDSLTIATGGNDRTVKLWQADDGTQQADLKGHNNIVTSVAFSPDGRWLASADINGLVILWDCRRQQAVRRFQAHDKWILDLAFSPDGSTLATASRDRRLRLWSLDGQLDAEFLGHTEGVTAVDFSPDGRELVTASADGSAIVWARSGLILATLADHDGWVRDARFSPDGTTIATSDDQNISLWNRDGTRRDRLLGHRDRIWSLSFSPTRSTLASASSDNTIRLWDYTDRAFASLSDHAFSSVAVSPNGQQIAAAADRVVYLYSPSGKLLAQLKGHTEDALTVAFDPQGKAIVSASDDGTARVWSLDPRQGYPERSILTHGGHVLAAVFSSDGKTIATAGDDGVVRLWDAQTGARQRTLYGHTDRALSLAFDPLNERLATAGADNTIRLWTRTGTEIATLNGHDSSVNWIAFSPDGQRIASASADNTIRIWTRDGTLIATLVGHTGPVNGVMFSADSQTIASVGDDRTLRLWHVNGQALLSFEAHDDRVLSVAFSADNQQLLTTSADQTLRVWDLNPDNLVRQGCDWVKPYLDDNPSVAEESRHICDDVVR